MVLVSAAKVLNKTHEGRYIVGIFNVNDLEWTKVILLAAEEARSPVTLKVSEGAAKYMCGFKTIVAVAREAHDNLGIAVPVALRLDHKNYEGTKACVKVGFTSTILGGSRYVFEENLTKSKEIIELARSRGSSIECEVGGISDEGDGVAFMSEPAGPQGRRTTAEPGIDFLAAEIGDIHGKYPADWVGPNFERLGEIRDVTNGKPLVLHSGSEIPADQITKAIPLGVSKINVNTELQPVFADATYKYTEARKDLEGRGYDLRRLLKSGYDAIKDRITSMMKGSGSYSKAE